MKNCLIQTFILLGLVTVAKAHGFIKLVILGALGLAGLWLLHTLAQDYQQIQGGNRPSGGSSGKLFFEKRSIFVNEEKINWERVLASDPVSCARSFICQLSALDEEKLDDDEKKILKLSRATDENQSWASQQLQEAIQFGEKTLSYQSCMERYKFCPFSSKTMTSLLRVFGSKT